jgi:purine-nucleoside phosphorylase
MDSRLAEYAKIATAHGVDSDEAALYKSRHWHDREFLALCRMIDHLLVKVGPPPSDWPEWLK